MSFNDRKRKLADFGQAKSSGIRRLPAFVATGYFKSNTAAIRRLLANLQSLFYIYKSLYSKSKWLLLNLVLK